MADTDDPDFFQDPNLQRDSGHEPGNDNDGKAPPSRDPDAFWDEAAKVMAASLADPDSGLRTFVKKYQEFEAQLVKLLATPKAQAFVARLPAFVERLKKVKKELPAQAQAALKAARFPPCNVFSLYDYQEIDDTAKEKGPDAATSMVEAKAREAFWNDGLRAAMLERWGGNPKFTRRMGILTSAVAAAAERKFDVAIPTLIAQMEGVVADLSGHSGQMREKDYKANVKDIAKHDPFFGDRVNEFLTDIVLVSFEHGKDLNSDLSRHAILHGADTNYGTDLNALKVIFFIDHLEEVSRRTPAEIKEDQETPP